MSNVISLDEKRAETVTYEAPMCIATSADFHFGIHEHAETPYAIVVHKSGQLPGIALTESEARQFAREIVETANVMRKARIAAEETPA
jgi:hypothetical protein